MGSGFCTKMFIGMGHLLSVSLGRGEKGKTTSMSFVIIVVIGTASFPLCPPPASDDITSVRKGYGSAFGMSLHTRTNPHR